MIEVVPFVPKDKTTQEKPQSDQEVTKKEQEKVPILQHTPIAPHLGVHYPANPNLLYQYPPPTDDILANILNALDNVPQFYTQVLHLMNKMNLPPPFRSSKSHIPSTIDYSKIRSRLDLFLQRLKNRPQRANSDEEEGEEDFDEEEGIERQRRQEKAKIKKNEKPSPSTFPLVVRPVRPFLVTSLPPSKKQKTVKNMERSTKLFQGQIDDDDNDKNEEETDDAKFVPESENAMIDLVADRQQLDSSSSASNYLALSSADRKEQMPEAEAKKKREVEEEISFFHFDPTSFSTHSSSPSSSSAVETTSSDPVAPQFVTDEDLQFRATEQEIVEKFPNYERGTPSNRLYIKNLAKSVSDQDLFFLFGRFDHSTFVFHSHFLLRHRFLF